MFRYIGNKTKLLPVLMEEIAENAPEMGTVADLMAGTGNVSLALRKKGYHVIASDMMTYSKHHLVTQLLFSAPPAFHGLLEVVKPRSGEAEKQPPSGVCGPS